jgi:hypothetical protein
MDKPWKVISAFIGVFAAGAVFGGFLTLRSASKRWEKESLLQRELSEAKTAAAVAAAQAAQAAQANQAPTVGAAAASPAPAPAAPPAVAARNAISASLMRQFAQRLKLSNEQREKMRPILARWGEDFQHLRQESERQQQQYLADSVRLSERMYREVGDLLTAEQRGELEKMRRETQERAERERQKRLEAAAAAKGGKGPLPVAAKQAEKAKPAGP